VLKRKSRSVLVSPEQQLIQFSKEIISKKEEMMNHIEDSESCHSDEDILLNKFVDLMDLFGDENIKKVTMRLREIRNLNFMRSCL